MKIIVFGASTSSQSINRSLAVFAASLIKGAQLQVLDLNDYDVPLFSEDIEKIIGKAEGAQRFLADLDSADGFVISFAEHNGNYTAAYKNLFDWATRIDQKVFKDKPTYFLATSPGPSGANSVLTIALQSAPYFGAQIKGSFSLANFYENFDLEGHTIMNEALLQQLDDDINRAFQ